MAVIKPFCAVRPRADLASKIAALPYDVYSKAEARKVVMENPFSFLKIDRAETQLDEETDTYSSEVYRCAADTLNQMIHDGEFIKDDVPCFYIYELTMNGRSQTGIGACASVSEYENKTIKKHENTRQEKEDDRTKHVETCRAQTGPIFLAYRYQEDISSIQKEVKQTAPVYDFTSSDDIRHRVWVISNPEMILKMQKCFEKIDTLYIADGHHRAASAVRVAKMKRTQTADSGRTYTDGAGVDRTSSEKQMNRILPEYEYFLSVLFADNELLVMDYNRWVHDLNGKDEMDFLEAVKKRFSVKSLPKAARPSKKGQISMYLAHRWYQLEKSQNIANDDVVENLDVSLLQNEILDPVLGIKDPKTDQRISFIGGIRGLGELEKLTDENGGVAFAMYPTSMGELFAVADADRLMPPKSTWFEPKLRSGLLIHQI
ncbi:MAG: DUF1015 domain-containing protein [Clostridia bacterium]|nr:DUF1015 domain-containing protein [Clostridia bacterium]NCC42740.1 DUF1015 domain-containing protein [Clostridia bacterium]